jgi:hypothetical protein
MAIEIKKYEDLNDLQRLAVVDFSYSRIDSYLQCPSKYFFTYIKKEPRFFSEPAVLRKYSSLGIRRYYI